MEALSKRDNGEHEEEEVGTEIRQEDSGLEIAGCRPHRPRK